jgi:hypothetical protein
MIISKSFVYEPVCILNKTKWTEAQEREEN